MFNLVYNIIKGKIIIFGRMKKTGKVHTHKIESVFALILRLQLLLIFFLPFCSFEFSNLSVIYSIPHSLNEH